MTVFRYRAITTTGRSVTGMREAASEDAVIQYIRALGHHPVYARHAHRPSFAASIYVRTRPPLRVLAHGTRELAALLGAGIELDRALGILLNLDGIDSLKRPLTAVRARIRDGASFAEALARENCFPQFYISAVRAGEYGSTLETALARLADYLARSLTVRDNITSALVYPCILIATAFAAIIFILLFVLPQFEPLFAEAGRRLPLSTRIVIAIGHGLVDYGWLAILSIAAGALWVRSALKRPHNRLLFHRVLLRLPVIGSLITTVHVERFFRTLSTLVGNGVPLPSALAVAGSTASNEHIAAKLRDTAAKLREGEHLSERLQRTGIFPSAAFDLIRVGEETGKLDVMLLRQADLDAERLKQTIDRFLALLVPVLTVLLGVIVAGLIASMLVALLSVNDLAL